MGTRTVLIANDPRAYRETIAVAIGMLCPDASVIVVDPDKLDESISEHKPEVVLSSHLTPLMESRVTTWAVLYADGEESALVQIDGRRKAVSNLELTGIVRLVDQQDEPAPA